MAKLLHVSASKVGAHREALERLQRTFARGATSKTCLWQCGISSGLRGSLGTKCLSSGSTQTHDCRLTVYQGGKHCLEDGFRSTPSMDTDKYIYKEVVNSGELSWDGFGNS